MKKTTVWKLSEVYEDLRVQLPSRYRPYKTRAGVLLLSLKESEMMFSRALGHYEKNKFDFLDEILRPGMIFVDVGANKGDFTVYASKKVKALGTVIAIEPHPTNRKWLKKNIALNRCRNVSVVSSAASSENSKAPFYIGKKSGWHSLKQAPSRQTGRQINVKTFQLDRLLENREISAVDCIKIDVEGGELAVLKGAREILKSGPTLLIDLHGDSKGRLAVSAFLKKYGYVCDGKAPELILRGCRVSRR